MFHYQILVAVVQGSQSNGQLVLHDATGEIRFLLCTSYCDQHSITERQQWTIANVAKLFGQSVVIRRWYAVVERISDPKNYEKDVSDLLYILCSEEDMFATSITQKLPASSSGHKTVYISEIYKQPLMLKCDQSSPYLNFSLECCSHSNIQSVHSSKKLMGTTHFNCKGQQLSLYPLLHYNCVYEALSKETDTLTNVTFVEGTPGVLGDVLEVTDIVSGYKLCHDSNKIDIKIVNFTGVLLNRRFCCKQGVNIPVDFSDLPSVKEGKMVYIKELGCGPIPKETLAQHGINPVYSQVKVVMEIEGRCYPDTLLVYYDLTLTPEPLGLIPGALLLFTHFQLSCNYGRITCSSSALSKVEVLAIDHKLLCVKPGLSYAAGSGQERLHKSSTPSLFAVDGKEVTYKITAMYTSLLSFLVNKLLSGLLTHACVKLRVVIVTILWVRVQYKCSTCDKLIVNDNCAPYCSLQQPRFSAECK